MVAWTGVERLKLGLYQQPPRLQGDGGVDSHVQVRQQLHVTSLWLFVSRSITVLYWK